MSYPERVISLILRHYLVLSLPFNLTTFILCTSILSPRCLCSGSALQRSDAIRRRSRAKFLSRSKHQPQREAQEVKHAVTHWRPDKQPHTHSPCGHCRVWGLGGFQGNRWLALWRDGCSDSSQIAMVIISLFYLLFMLFTFWNSHHNYFFKF